MRDGGWADWRIGGLLVMAACGHPSVHPAIRPAVAFSPDHRFLISDFSYIEALAASPWLVFAATPHGLLIYDRVAHRFRPPITVIDGYPPGRVRRAVADPAGNAVYLDVGTTGGYVRFDVDGRTWTAGQLPSEPSVGTLTVDAALASAPLADAMRAAILTDARLRTYNFTTAAATPDRPEIYLGTNGLGLIRVDKQTGEWEVLGYGLVAPAVGALAPAADGVWAGANARAGQRRGITWLARDLSRTRIKEFTFLYSRRLLSVRGDLWIATEQGVVRIDSATFQSRLFDIPDPTCLASHEDGVWVGAARGLFHIGAEGEVTELGPRGVAVISLLAARDTLWVGTANGLGVVPPGSDQIVVPPELVERPSLRVPVYAIAQVQDTIVIATDKELRWRNPVSRAWTSIPFPLSIGVPTTLAADPNGGLWLGGWGGVARIGIANRSVQMHPVPIDLPAPVRDLMSDGEYLWIATDSGVVRVR